MSYMLIPCHICKEVHNYYWRRKEYYFTSNCKAFESYKNTQRKSEP